MNDIRRTILWVVFGFSLVMLWDQWQIHNGKPTTFLTNRSSTTEKSTSSAGASELAAKSSLADSNSIKNITQAVPASSPYKKIEISTDVFKITFDSEGGNVVGAELLRHKDAHHAGQNVKLLIDNDESVYIAQSGLISSTAKTDLPNTLLPNHKTPMRFSGGKSLQEGEEALVVKFESEPVGDLTLVKTYLFKRGSYVVEVQHDIYNRGGLSISPKLYLRLLRDGKKPEGESAFYSTFTGPAFYTLEKKYQKISFEDIEKEKIEQNTTDGYIAMVQHYFASAWLIENEQQRTIYAEKIDKKYFAINMVVPLLNISPREKLTHTSRLFIGPQEEKNLETIYPGLEFVKDYGLLAILSKPLYWLLYELNKQIDNWGWSIVALVVLLKIAFYWLNSQAYKSMGKMKAINPKIMEMRERLKDNPQQMQMEMMKIYREEKVNPLGGCLPIAVQIPFFIALYWVLLSSVEMRNAPWVGWIHDLAAPDTAFGVWFGVPIGLLPILMTGTSLLQTWLNPTPPDPVQAKMMWIMPLAFSVMFFFFPSGLVLYWLSNNILSIAQQWMINKQLGVLH